MYNGGFPLLVSFRLTKAMLRNDPAARFMMPLPNEPLLWSGTSCLRKQDQTARIERLLNPLAKLMDIDSLRQRISGGYNAFMEEHGHLLEPGDETDEGANAFNIQRKAENTHDLCWVAWEATAPYFRNLSRQFLPLFRQLTPTTAKYVAGYLLHEDVAREVKLGSPTCTLEELLSCMRGDAEVHVDAERQCTSRQEAELLVMDQILTVCDAAQLLSMLHSCPLYRDGGKELVIAYFDTLFAKLCGESPPSDGGLRKDQIEEALAIGGMLGALMKLMTKFSALVGERILSDLTVCGMLGDAVLCGEWPAWHKNTSAHPRFKQILVTRVVGLVARRPAAEQIALVEAWYERGVFSAMDGLWHQLFQSDDLYVTELMISAVDKPWARSMIEAVLCLPEDGPQLRDYRVNEAVQKSEPLARLMTETMAQLTRYGRSGGNRLVQRKDGLGWCAVCSTVT